MKPPYQKMLHDILGFQRKWKYKKEKKNNWNAKFIWASQLFHLNYGLYHWSMWFYYAICSVSAWFFLQFFFVRILFKLKSSNDKTTDDEFGFFFFSFQLNFPITLKSFSSGFKSIFPATKQKKNCSNTMNAVKMNGIYFQIFSFTCP